MLTGVEDRLVNVPPGDMPGLTGLPLVAGHGSRLQWKGLPLTQALGMKPKISHLRLFPEI